MKETNYIICIDMETEKMWETKRKETISHSFFFTWRWSDWLGVSVGEWESNTDHEERNDNTLKWPELHQNKEKKRDYTTIRKFIE